MRKYIFAALLAVGCGSSALRESCYASAEATSAARAVAECKSTGWDACPTKDAIQTALKSEEAACPN